MRAIVLNDAINDDIHRVAYSCMSYLACRRLNMSNRPHWIFLASLSAIQAEISLPGEVSSLLDFCSGGPLPRPANRWGGREMLPETRPGRRCQIRHIGGLPRVARSSGPGGMPEGHSQFPQPIAEGASVDPQEFCSPSGPQDPAAGEAQDR